MDETRLAYVQVRFSGYIQKVFADATYQYVRKGQPLFTLYSPDLVATESGSTCWPGEKPTAALPERGFSGNRRRRRRTR